jgi:adenylate kinase
MKVIAVVGLSGVGKTAMLRQLSSRFPVMHLQASALIKTELTRLATETPTSEQLRTGRVLDNQAALVIGFRNAVRGYDGVVLFDGHTVIDTGDCLIEIPTSVFADLQCDQIVVVTEDSHEIARRREADFGRKRPVRSPLAIRDQQKRSTEVAQQIAMSLRIPCVIQSGSSLISIESIVREFLRE